MGQTIVTIPGIIEGATVYADNDLVARDETISLPEIKHATYTQKLPGGEQDMPSGRLEDMEMSVTKNGLNQNAFKFINAKKIEVRWSQYETQTDGTVKKVGYRAFMDTLSITLNPGASIETGSGIENDLTKKVLAYSLYRNGKEIVNVNKITGVQKIYGKNYGVAENLL